MKKGNNRVEKQAPAQPEKLELNIGNVDVCIIKLLNQINQNIVILINEVRNGRQIK